MITNKFKQLHLKQLIFLNFSNLQHKKPINKFKPVHTFLMCVKQKGVQIAYIKIGIQMSDSDQLKRWELYRLEMENFEQRMADLAKDFLELGAYEESAKCSSRAETTKFIRGRMPPKLPSI